MKLIVTLTIGCGILLSGCIAGPTPHPSTNEDDFASSQDTSAGAPAANGEASSCEESGGFWDGDECVDGLDSKEDATSGSDGQVEPSNDVDDDTSEDDSVGDVPQVDIATQDAS
jgi:hypothetical protein